MNKEAFVYCWTDHLRNMLYIGYHKGSVDDGYICSSKLMKQHYFERTHDFTRQILAQGSEKDMLNFERHLLLTIDAKNNKDFYNQSNGCRFYRIKEHTDETKQKMSIAAIGRTLTDETKQKMSLAKIGIVPYMKGRTHTDETKQKMSLAKLNKPSGRKGIKMAPLTDERKLHLSKINKGKTLTEEHKMKISQSRREYHANLKDEDNPYLGRELSPEHKLRISESSKNKPKVECPHCGKIGSGNSMSRWHFDNCKHRVKEADYK